MTIFYLVCKLKYKLRMMSCSFNYIDILREFITRDRRLTKIQRSNDLFTTDRGLVERKADGSAG